MNSCPFVVQNHPLRFIRSHCPRCTNSRLLVFICGSKPPAAKPLQDRSRAGKPDLHKFVSIRVHSWFKTTPCVSPAATPALHEFVPIRVHSWFKTTRRVSPAALPALHEFVSIRVHSWFKTPPCVSPAATAALHEFVVIRVHSWFKTTPCVSPAATPALHEFVVIRVHSWFKTTPLRLTRSHSRRCTNSWLFVSIRGSKRPPCVSPAATAALDAVTSSEVQPDATTDKVLPAVDEGILQ